MAIVGSGPGSLRNPPELVDSHEVVVRVNNYRLLAGTGRRTDVFYSFFGRSIRKPAEELLHDGVRLCICKCPDAKFMESPWHERMGKQAGVDFRAIYQRREGWWPCDTYIPSTAEFMRNFDLLGGHVPTTGFAAVLDVLSFGPRHVFLTGFDFFQSRVHNVTEQWKPGNPTDPIGHVPDAERDWLRANAPSLPISMDAQLQEALHGKVQPQLPPVRLPLWKQQLIEARRKEILRRRVPR